MYGWPWRGRNTAEPLNVRSLPNLPRVVVVETQFLKKPCLRVDRGFGGWTDSLRRLSGCISGVRIQASAATIDC
jgi:hypothetical protein